MSEFAYELKIPRERIAVLIGKKGEQKRKLEEETNTEISVDSKEGEIFVKGSDALSLYTTRDIIKAIGRGFNPDVAQLLLKQDYCFEMVNISDYVKPNHLERIKGRVIGTNGKTRNIIQHLTETFISVYGKTISIIGQIENVATAKRAVESIVQGSPHANVYKWLEKMIKENKRREFEESQPEFFRENFKVPKEIMKKEEDFKEGL
ncbi:MAG: KH domain-containing protein [Nanoarchaeota archaeon]|nr:KH domain-containing protein [Nanoarchaeota archaeon]